MYKYCEIQILKYVLLEQVYSVHDNRRNMSISVRNMYLSEQKYGHAFNTTTTTTTTKANLVWIS